MKKKQKKKERQSLWKKVKSGLLTALVLFGALGITAAEGTTIQAQSSGDDGADSNASGGETVTGENTWVIKDDGVNGITKLSSASAGGDELIEVMARDYGWRLGWEQHDAKGNYDNWTKVREAVERAYNKCVQNYQEQYINTGLTTEPCQPRVVAVGMTFFKANDTETMPNGNRYSTTKTLVGGSTLSGNITRWATAFDNASKGASLKDKNGVAYGVTEYVYNNKTTCLRNSALNEVGEYTIFRVVVVDQNSPQLTKNVTVELQKSSAEESITNGNKMYSLKDAVYYVYSDANCTNKIAEITTDENGKGSAMLDNQSPDLANLYLKEIKAPEGYKLSDEVIPVTLGKADGSVSGSSAENVYAKVSIDEEPLNDPLSIKITKSNASVSDNVQSLEGTEFTITYYDSLDEDYETNYTTKREWTIKALKDGKSYKAFLDSEFIVSGDDLYKNTGDTGTMGVLPIGTYTVKETKAAKGYTLNGTVVVEGQTVSADTTLKFTVKEGEDKKSTIISYSNELEVPDNPKTALSVNVKKYDYYAETSTPVADGTDFTTTLKLINNNDYNVSVKIDGTAREIAPGEANGVEFKTDSTGFAELRDIEYGSYTIKEVVAPTGYLIDGKTSIDFTVDDETTDTVIDFTASDKTAINSGLFDKPITSYIAIEKDDSSLHTNEAQGDTDLSATFEIRNASDKTVYVDLNGNGSIEENEMFDAGERICLVRTNADGTFDSEKQGYYDASTKTSSGTPIAFPYGTYKVTEIEAPVGYTLNEANTTTLTVRENGEKLKATFENTPVTGDFDIYKHYNKQTGSELDDAAEEGATFLAIIESTLNEKFDGDYFKAYEAIVDIIGDDHVADGDVSVEGTEANTLWKTYGITPKEFSIVTTGKDGLCTSDKLVYGTYKIHQVEGDLDAKILDDAATFNVEGEVTTTTNAYGDTITLYNDQTSTKHYYVTNDYITYQLGIYKKDAQTGKTVTYNSASFKLAYDSNGNGVFDEEDMAYSKKLSDYSKIVDGFVVETVAGKEYDVFRTYTENDGVLPKGTFVIDSEDATADDLGKAQTAIKVDRGTYFIIEVDNDKSTYNETPWGYVTPTSGEKTDITGNNYLVHDGHAKYPVVGKVQITENQLVEMKDGDTEKTFEDDEYFVTVNINDDRALGKLVVKKTIEEADEDVDTTFIDRTDLSGFKFELRAAENIIDPADGTVITKEGELAKALVNGEYFEAGAFNVDAEGNYTLENIPLGKYVLKEVGQQKGTVTNDTVYDVVFEESADRTQSVIEQSIEIENLTTKTKIYKADVNGESLGGATLVIKDSEGNTVTKVDGDDLAWTTGGETVYTPYVDGEALDLSAYNIKADGSWTFNGKEYILSVSDNESVELVKETDGWKLLNAFRVDGDDTAEDGVIELATFTADQVEIKETKTDSKAYYYVEGLTAGETYTLEEANVPSGYVKATPQTFTVADTDEVQTITMVDKKYSVSKVDVDGKEIEGAEITVIDDDGNIVDKWTSTTEEHFIENLEEGKHYTLHEEAAPNGYVKVTDVGFTVLGADEDGVKIDEHVDMIDKRVVFSKLDVGGEEIEGAEITVTDTESGEVVDSWTSTKDVHYINGLEEGHSYVLHEEAAPNGYVKATDVPFTVTGMDEDGIKVDQEVDMTDMRYTVSKLDVGGKEIEGAEITVIEKESGETVDKWTSTTEVHAINGLEEGKTYILHEEAAPNGYVKVTDVEFSIPDEFEGGVKVDKHVDMIDKRVEFSKLDVGGKEIEGAEITVTDTATGEVVDSWTSTKEVHYINNLEEGHSYVLHEEAAPNGYVKATDVPFTVTGMDEDGIKVDQEVDMTDMRYTLYKTDGLGNEVEGATVQIIDKETGDVVDEWVSTKEGHDISGLEEGKTYTWHEEGAPDGYYYAEDKDFTITVVDGEPKLDVDMEMVDAPIVYYIEKVDNNGDPVEGVTLKLTDVTDPENPVEVELPNDGVTTKEKMDMTGKLIAGHSYVLEEIAIVDGVFKADNIEFTVEKYNPGDAMTITMVDDLTSIAIKKVTPSGEALAGAKMQILEAVPASEETTDSTATADETTATKPEEDAVIDPEFSVDSEEETVDEGVAVLSEETGEVAEKASSDIHDTGATLEEITGEATKEDTQEATKADIADELDPIYTNTDTYVPATDENGNVIVAYEFTTTDDVKGTDISKYVQGGKTYILREVEAPFGFEKIEDKVFTVSGKENSYQLIQAVDTRETYTITATKVDATDKSKTLEGAEITLFTGAGKVAVDVNGQACIATTGKDGKVSWNVAYNDDLGGYYVMETKSPKGYKLNKDKFEVKLASDYDFAENNPITIVITDEPNKKTGVGAIAIGAGIGIVGATGGLVALKKKKKEDDAEDSAE